MGRISLPYLVQRNRVFYFRRVVPSELRESLGYREFIWSLKTCSPVEACGLIPAALARSEQIIANAKGLGGSEAPASAYEPQLPVSWRDKNDRLTPTIREAWEAYRQENAKGWRPATLQEYERTIHEFLSPGFVGDKSLARLGRNDLIKYREILRCLPVQRTKHKHYRTLSVGQLLDLKLPRSACLSDRSINERLILLGSFFGWCRHVQGWLTDDVTYKVQLKAPSSRERAAFTEEDIGKLFGSPEYRDNLHRHPYQFWVPLLGLFTGARISELCQLQVADVIQVDGIACLSIREGDEKSLKTEAARRLVPLHSELLRLGFIDYVRSAADKGRKRIFPEISKEKHWGATASKWFTRYRRKVGVPDLDSMGREKVFHSFRKTVVTHLRQNRLADGTSVDVGVVQQIIGHERTLFGTTEIYTQDFPLIMCRDAIETLSFYLAVRGGASSSR